MPRGSGRFRPSLMVEVWIALRLYGGGCMDHLPLPRGRGVRRLFGWGAIPDPATMGRWLRRSGQRLAGVLDRLLWRMVRGRWEQARVPRSVMLVLDSTVGPKRRSSPLHRYACCPIFKIISETHRRRIRVESWK